MTGSQHDDREYMEAQGKTFGELVPLIDTVWVTKYYNIYNYLTVGHKDHRDGLVTILVGLPNLPMTVREDKNSDLWISDEIQRVATNKEILVRELITDLKRALAELQGPKETRESLGPGSIVFYGNPIREQVIGQILGNGSVQMIYNGRIARREDIRLASELSVQESVKIANDIWNILKRILKTYPLETASGSGTERQTG